MIMNPAEHYELADKLLVQIASRTSGLSKPEREFLTGVANVHAILATATDAYESH